MQTRLTPRNGLTARWGNKTRKRLLRLGAALSIFLSTGVCSAAVLGDHFYSPVRVDALKRLPGVTYKLLIDHEVIEFDIDCRTPHCISKVIEQKWEDADAFDVYDHEKKIHDEEQASPYWGYLIKDDANVFFVDYPLVAPDGAKYSDVEYTYSLMNLTGEDVRSYDCTFYFARLNDHSRAASKPFDPTVDNPFPQIISKFLSEHGPDLKLDKCVLRK